jgi:hypothetical protein
MNRLAFYAMAWVKANAPRLSHVALSLDLPLEGWRDGS